MSVKKALLAATMLTLPAAMASAQPVSGPYIGAGVNYTVFYGEGGPRSAPVNKVSIDNAFGYGINFGIDVEVAPRWLVNLDAKKLWLRPDVSVNGGAITGHANIDPWIVGASVRYRF